MGEDLVRRAVERRRALLEQLSGEDTDCYRLFHGVAEGRAGLTIDRYGPVLLLQTWREPLTPTEVDDYHRAVEDACGWSLAPTWNHRADKSNDVIAEGEAPVGRELGVRYDVSPRHRGQDPLLFLDLRAGRISDCCDSTACSVSAAAAGALFCDASGGVRPLRVSSSTRWVSASGSTPSSFSSLSAKAR